MATTADSSSANPHSPRAGGGGGGGEGPSSAGDIAGGGGVNSLRSPWAQVVRGGGGGDSRESGGPTGNQSPEMTSAPLERSGSADKQPLLPVGLSQENSTDMENSEKSNVGSSGKKGAWNKPSNGVVEGSSSVMGASSWPDLSEAARVASQKASLMDSGRSGGDGLIAVSQGPVTSVSQPRQGNANVNPESSANNAAPVRQKSFRRGGGSRQARFPHGPPTPPPLPTFPVLAMTQDNFGNTVPVVPDSSPRDARTGGFVTESQVTNGRSTQRNSSRRGNFGHARGDGRNNSYGGRHDQDPVNHDGNSSQGLHGRDAQGQGQPHRPRGRGFPRPSVQGAVPFMTQAPVRSYGNTMFYPDVPSPVYYVSTLPPEPYRGVPFVPAPTPTPYYVHFLMQDPSLPQSIVEQIDYYFSDGNLVKDEYLRSKMDDQGWVPVKLIASFPRVQNLTSNIPLILESLRASTVVEVEGENVRRRNDWMKWILSSQRSINENPEPSAGSSSSDKLAAAMEKASLEDAIPDNKSSDQSTSQSIVSNGEISKS